MEDAPGEVVSDRVVTIPNALSALRLVLVPVFLVYVIVGDDVAALVILVVSSATDFFDGVLARKLGQITRLGQLLDPAADRLFIFAALVGLAVRDVVPWWLVVIIVGRDVVLLVVGVVLASAGYGPLPVHHLGKVATFCLLYAFPLLMLGQAFPPAAFVSVPLGWAFALWGAFLYWWAAVVYTIETVRLTQILPPAERPESDTLGGQRTGEVHMVDAKQSHDAGPHNDGSSQPPTTVVNVAVPGAAVPGGLPAEVTDTTAHFREDFEAQLASLSSEVSPEELEAVGALPSGSALLIVRRGPNVGARFLLDSDVTTAGRHPEADIFLDDVTVSRRHSEFARSGIAFEIRDLGSLNGTYFDGVRVDAATLVDGSEVQIGKFRLTFYASRLDLAARSAN